MLETALDNLDSKSGDAHIKDLANRVRHLQQQQRQQESRQHVSESNLVEHEEVEET